MSEHGAHVVELRTLPHNLVFAVCMDCEKSLKGYLGVQFFEQKGERGLEVLVCCGEEAHAIARVQVRLIPHVGGESGHCPAAS